MFPCFAVTAKPASAGDDTLYAAIYVRVNGVAVAALDVMDTLEYVVTQRFPGPIPEDPAIREELQLAAIRAQVVAFLALDEAKTMQIDLPRDSARRNIEQYLEASGLRESQLRPAVRRILEANALIDLILIRKSLVAPAIPPARVREFYDRNRMTHFRDRMEVAVRHIYLAPAFGEDMASVRTRMEQIRATLLAQPSAEQRSRLFAETAQRDSQDKFSALGGLLPLTPDKDGFFPQDFNNEDKDGNPIFPQPMVTAIRNFTTADRLSPVVFSERGAHLLYCEKVRGGRIRPFREAQPMIVRYLEMASREQFVNIWLRDKHRRSLIYWNDGSEYSITDLIPPDKPSGENPQVARR